MELKHPILPKKQEFARIHSSHDLDFKAICIFAATGFFMDDDTYWTDYKCLLPAHTHMFDNDHFLIESNPWFKWHYTPQNITFETALEDYIALLKEITKSQVDNQKVILPLSGGLDSRSQALILKDLDNTVHAYSYSFDGGYPEHKISSKIAKVCGFEFDAFKIPKSYLWGHIEELAHINKCYSEFTHSRQMAVLPQLKQMEGVFSLGHWGDVFFNRGVPEGTKEFDVISLLLKKMLKPGGMYLAQQLWDVWNLEGNFKDYFVSRIQTALFKIKIENLSAKVRAFKTSQWAHRWTTTNLSIFEAAHPITLPYYDDRMCEFICTIPEDYLADRRLQIAHLKQHKDIANITWHEQKPFNINNYNYNKIPYNLPYRILDKLKREGNAFLGRPFIQRNYELQFLGAENDRQLRERIFSNHFTKFIPSAVTDDIYNKFTGVDNVFYSHPMSMLLTLSLWNQHYNKN